MRNRNRLYCSSFSFFFFVFFSQMLHRALRSIVEESKMGRVSYFRTQNQTKRKTLSKLSMIGFNGAGVLFHKRGDRLKVRFPIQRGGINWMDANKLSERGK